MSAKPISIISGLVIVDTPEAFYIIDNNDIECLCPAFGILDHLLEGSSAQCAGAAYGIIDIELY